MLLTDLEDNEVECVLFDECASDAYMCQLENISSPIVVVLNLARIGFSDDGRPQLSNSFNATRVSFNPAIKEVKELLKCAKEHSSPIVLTFSDPITKRMSQPTGTASFDTHHKIPICDINNKSVGDSFIIHCEVYKLETRHGWIYDGCSKCATKPRIEGSILMCAGCKKKPNSIEAKVKLHYIVKDESGTVSVIFWDKHDVQLIGKSAAQMKDKLHEEGRSYDFPDELDDIVGKRMLLRLKLNDYNKKHPNASISVSNYTVCENLLDQFNDQASIEVAPVVNLFDEETNNATSDYNTSSAIGQHINDKENMKISDVNAYNSSGDHSNHKQNLDSCNINASNSNGHHNNDKENIKMHDHTQDVPLPLAKGRRRTSVKRTIARDEVAHLKEVPINSFPDDRLYKVIKQEK